MAGRAGRQAGRRQAASHPHVAPRKPWPAQQQVANELEWTVTVSVKYSTPFFTILPLLPLALIFVL